MNYTYYRRYRPSKKKTSSFRSFFGLVLFLVVLVLVAKACVSMVGTIMAEKRDEATLTVNEGSAEVTEWGQENSEPASDAQLLLVGDRVKTASGSLVTLQFSDGLEIRLDENTALTFTDAKLGETEDLLSIELNEGRAWIVQEGMEDHEVVLEMKTLTMNLSSTQSTYLVANLSTKQYVYPFDGEVHVDFVDRSAGDSVIEGADLKRGQKAILTEEAQKALLARENIQLVGEAGDDLLMDRFVMWNLGSVETFADPLDGEGEEENLAEEEETPEEETPDEEEIADETSEEVTEEETSTGLALSVTSPGLNVTIQKDAIAIEGIILSGTANTVTVTWAGNNQPYTLGGFAPGDTSFRYVADASYGNLKAGSNTYTIVATSADGTQSAPVTVTINAEF